MSTADVSAGSLFHALYQDHRGWLHAWLRRRLGCSEQAADLTHDTYLRLIVSGRLPEPAQSRLYLLQIAKGLVIDLHRRRVLETTYLEALASLPEAEMPSAEHQALVLDLLTRIDRMLDELPARVREAFMLSQFDGLTYGAIAARMHVSVGSVRKYMLKAATACLLTLDAASVDEALR
jgi:RNA polymerase sigma-70 factor (ECF subfamily)